MDEVTIKLTALLEDEIRAVKTYERLIARLSEGQLKSVLEDYKATHERRIHRLSERLGLDEASFNQRAARPWDEFRGIMDDADMLSVLEDGENSVLDDYKIALMDLDADAQRFVERQLVPEQERVLKSISELHKRIEEKNHMHYPWV